jgi:hypothetical protein
MVELAVLGITQQKPAQLRIVEKVEPVMAGQVRGYVQITLALSVSPARRKILHSCILDKMSKLPSIILVYTNFLHASLYDGEYGFPSLVGLDLKSGSRTEEQISN